MSGTGKVFLQYVFEHDLVGEKIGNNSFYISHIGVVFLLYEFCHDCAAMKMCEMFFYKEYTKIVCLLGGFFHDFSDLNVMRMFVDILGKGMVFLQYVFSYESLDNFHT